MTVTTVLVRNELHDKGARTGHWAVVVDGVERSRHRKKATAVAKARQAARGNKPAVLKIQDTAGQWATETSYR